MKQTTMRAAIKIDHIRLATIFLLVPVLAGCAARTTLPPTAVAVQPTAVAVQSTAVTVQPTAVAVQPTAVATTAVASTAGQTSTAAPTSTQEAVDADTAGRLVSQRTGSPPVIDGRIEQAWTAVDPLAIPLTWGVGGTEHALDVDLRALHTAKAVYFLAQWPGTPPSGEEHTVFNKLTLHWRFPEQMAQSLDCSVVCHTAFADGKGRFVYANTETIPQGGSGALLAAGGWDAGIWTLEWSRPLVSANPFDLQLDDKDQAYTFLVKVFERIKGRPDPVSDRYLLVFQP